MILATFAALHLFAITSLNDMSSQDQKNTGVHRLTDKEKAALQQWIDANYQKKSSEEESTAHRDVKGINPTLSENLLNSQYLRLSDGTLWNVRVEDVPIAQAWITPVEIVVTKSSNPFFPYRLTNTVSGSSVLARKVEKLPQASPPPPAPKSTGKMF
jgi:hypothetical protein